MQNHRQHQKLKHQTQRPIVQSTSSVAAALAINFTNTAKLPIETVKLLIASVSLRPNLWNRNSNGHKRSDINALWQQVSQEVNLPANICRVKWGHLRDNFRKVFIRNTLSTEPPTTWRFYNDMRFMETVVAENVMRHHKLRTQFLHWESLHNAEQRQSLSTSSTAVLNDDCDSYIPNQFNFSGLAAFFQNQGPAINKRIKLETFDSESSLDDSNDVTLPPNTFCQNGKDYEQSANHLQIGNRKAVDVLDDDQFDEDATAVDVNDQFSIQNERFSFENSTKINVQQSRLSNQDIKAENTCAKLDEHDSDRMFLFSLLPYLRKVKEQRKLYVRQRLQDVLIQEFG